MEEKQSAVASLLYEVYNNPTGKPSSSLPQDAQQPKIAKKGRREKGRSSNTVVVNKNKEINYHFHVYSPRPAKQKKKRKFNQTTQSEHDKPSHQGEQTQRSIEQKLAPWNADSHLALLSSTLRCIELYRTIMFPFLPLHPCVFEEGNVAHLLSTHEVSLDQVPLRLNTFACLAMAAEVLADHKLADECSHRARLELERVFDQSDYNVAWGMATLGYFHFFFKADQEVSSYYNTLAMSMCYQLGTLNSDVFRSATAVEFQRNMLTNSIEGVKSLQAQIETASQAPQHPGIQMAELRPDMRVISWVQKLGWVMAATQKDLTQIRMGRMMKMMAEATGGGGGVGVEGVEYVSSVAERRQQEYEWQTLRKTLMHLKAMEREVLGKERYLSTRPVFLSMLYATLALTVDCLVLMGKKRKALKYARNRLLLSMAVNGDYLRHVISYAILLIIMAALPALKEMGEDVVAREIAVLLREPLELHQMLRRLVKEYL